MAKEDYVEVMKEGRRKRGEGEFRRVYTPSKKKDEKMAMPSMDYEQTVTLKKKDFPEMMGHKIGDDMCVTIKGPAVRMDKEGVSMGVHMMKMMKMEKED